MKSVVAFLVGAAGATLAAFGILIWIAIPESDTATSDLFLTVLLLVVGGLVLGAAAFALLRHRTRPRRP